MDKIFDPFEGDSLGSTDELTDKSAAEYKKKQKLGLSNQYLNAKTIANTLSKTLVYIGDGKFSYFLVFNFIFGALSSHNPHNLKSARTSRTSNFDVYLLDVVYYFVLLNSQPISILFLVLKNGLRSDTLYRHNRR